MLGIFEYILLGLLLVAAVFIIAAVTIQKSSEDGISGTIMGGGSDTYYGKDKSKQSGKLLNKWTLIISLVFAVAVLLVYIIQPDYINGTGDPQGWQDLVNREYYIFVD